MESNEYILELNNIYKQFGNLIANNHVSIKIKRNSIHAIVGENGAGKSTLMNILTCVYKMDAGKILLMEKKYISIHPRMQQRPVSVWYIRSSCFIKE